MPVNGWESAAALRCPRRSVDVVNVNFADSCLQLIESTIMTAAGLVISASSGRRHTQGHITSLIESVKLCEWTRLLQETRVSSFHTLSTWNFLHIVSLKGAVFPSASLGEKK